MPNHPSLAEKGMQLPDTPGVYLMKGSSGEILYVGKALSLKKRVSSYFSSSSRFDPKTEVLVRQIRSFDVVLTATEQEALILEANLIKRHRPRYNIFHKDDKRYPSLRIDPFESYPILELVRRIRNDGAVYFGPYASGQSVRETLKFIHRTFRLRKCKTRPLLPRSRPCLNHQMGLCLGLCARKVPEEEYRKTVDEVILFLKGRTPNLISAVESQMREASARLDFEEAAGLRDKAHALKRIMEKQVTVSTDFMDRDVFAFARMQDQAVVTRLHIRGGFLLGTQHLEFAQTLANDGEALGSFLLTFYEQGRFIPQEVLTATKTNEAGFISHRLSEMKGRRVRVWTPRRGEKARLIALAVQNANSRLKSLSLSKAQDMDRVFRLQRKLKMSHPPLRIECVDNSTTFGAEPVASLVVFENGLPEPSRYRHYRIRTVQNPDDYAFMEEVLRRRFDHADREDFPDLLMVDGGKGQLNIADAVVRDLIREARFHIIAIAKKDKKKGEPEDKVYALHRADAVNFGRETDLLHFLQRIRDEAHRFAVTFHRKKRRITALQSALDAVPGIGKKRKQLLLKHFRGVEGIRAASRESIAALPGITPKTAGLILDVLGNKTDPAEDRPG